MSALLVGAATSQTAPSGVINNQVQLGDVFSTQTLNVVTATDGVSSTAQATGNAASAYAVGSNMDVRSNQTMVGATAARTTVNVSGGMGANSGLNTTAVANNASLGATQATATGVVTQIATFAPSVTANSQIEGYGATAGNVTSVNTAVANNADLSLNNGTAGVLVNQSSAATVRADGGAILEYVSGEANIGSVAVGNNMSGEGANSSAYRASVNQTNTGAITQATMFTAYGNAQTANTSAIASGNVISNQNEGPLLDVASTQSNSSYVRAQAEGSAYLFGTGTATAYGVGNSNIVGNSGQELVLDNTQVNSGGGVEAIASFSGQDGYDASASARAAGNDVTGYACSYCAGSMTVNNRQTNSADVGATSNVSVGGTARSVSGSSSAVGNNASFYVTRP